jgi:hypothetical protein
VSAQQLHELHAHAQTSTTNEGGEGDVTKDGAPATTTTVHREAVNATVAGPPICQHEPDPSDPDRCSSCYLILPWDFDDGDEAPR